MLAFFNAPENVPKHESMACRAALEALREMTLHPLAAGFSTRVGLHSGDMLVGNFGTKERFAYTVLGDAVNVASRLEGLNKIYGTRVIASDAVRLETGDDFEWRHLDRVAVAGRQGGMEIHELMALKGEGGRQKRDVYEQALAHYFARRFHEAGELFRRVAESNDKAAVLMTIRCDHYLRAQLPVDWNGVYSHELK
jgi:adenylate cyclase